MAANATKIDVYLKNASGAPLTNTRFVIKPVRAGFWSEFNGIVEDKEIVYVTDQNGYVQIELWPLPYPYYMTYSYDEDAIPGHFMFYVPAVDYTLQLQDLIVTKVDAGDKYAEDVLKQIIEAKVATLNAAAEAALSEGNAEKYAENAAKSAEQASEDAQTTTNDRNQVAVTNQQLIDIYTSLQKATVVIQGIALSGQLTLGEYTLWVDSTGRLRIIKGKPVDLDSDGTVVGTQS